jgi:hypothetical protein
MGNICRVVNVNIPGAWRRSNYTPAEEQSFDSQPFSCLPLNDKNDKTFHRDAAEHFGLRKLVQQSDLHHDAVR